jgi:hypothetical protein
MPVFLVDRNLPGTTLDQLAEPFVTIVDALDLTPVKTS